MPKLIYSAICAADEAHPHVVPVAVGGGLPALQPNSLVRLELVDNRRFADGDRLLGSLRVAGKPPRPAN